MSKIQSTLRQGEGSINKIITKIEQQFSLFFKVPMTEQFEPEQIYQFRDIIKSSPQNYEQIIYQNLGFNRKYKQFVENLKNSNEFLQLIKPTLIKPIHRLIFKHLKLGKNTNVIYNMKMDPIMEWSLQNIIKENQRVEKELFKERMKSSKCVQDFFIQIEDYFLDCCIRKLDISENILNINRISLQAAQTHPQLKQLLKQITCSDFIKLYAHFYPNKEYFGQILHKLAMPIPVLFTAKTQQGFMQFNYPQLLNFIARERNFCLITSIGTAKIAGKGKTAFLQRMFFQNKKNMSNGYSYFHESSVDFYTKVPHKLQQKNILIADFHGDGFKQSQRYSSLLKICLKVSNIILIHLSQRQGTPQTQQNAAFLQKYNTQILPFLSMDSNTILLLRDCRQIDEQIFFQRNHAMDMIKLPNCTDNQNLPVIELRFDKLYKKMQQFDVKKTIRPQTFFQKEQLMSYQKNRQKVDKLINLLISTFRQDSQKFYQRAFPNLKMQLDILSLKQETIKLEIEIRSRQVQINEQREIHINYNTAKARLAKLMKQQTSPISQLAKQLVDLIYNNPQLMHLFAYQLSAWRQKETECFLGFIITKTIQYNNIDRDNKDHQEQRQQLKQLIKSAQKTLQSYDISIDTFFAEIIAAISHSKRKFKTRQAGIIKQYYDQAYKGIMPINLIEGKTLSFGNPFLQQFFDHLSRSKYKNKQIFVVSVVGAQSSAKSTILNYIFRCNFATSVGRCTKGVYFTIVQCEQKVIVVVDTEGLLSVAARDHTFDIQIACFVMLISDLVIMNNKGEVNATLRDLLGVCVYAIDQLTSSDLNEAYQPNKIIFTIRDQVEYGGSKQKQMLSMIIKSLNENSIKYSNYIDFTDEDIYPLQSAFTTQNVGNFCIQAANNSFGKSIMALRTRIIGMLQKPKNKTLMHFYLNSKRRWESIQGCGQSIVNFKMLYSIRLKQDMKQLLQILKKQAYGRFINDQQNIISKYYQKELQSQEQIESDLKNYYHTFKRDVLEEFNKRCEEKMNEKELLREFQFQVEEFCGFWHKEYLLKLKKRLIEMRFEQQNNKFKSQIKAMLAESITKRKSDEQILAWLEQQKYNLKKTLITQMQRVQNKQRSLGQNELTTQITRKVESFLKKYYKKMNISYQNFETIKKQYSQINQSKVKREKLMLFWFQIKIENKDEQGQDKVQKDKQQIVKHLCNFLNDCDRTVNSLIKFELNADIHKIEELMKKIMEQLLQDYQILMSNLQKYFQRYQLQPFTVKQKGIILSRFISTFPKKFQKTYYETSKNNLQIKITEQEKVLDQLTKEVKQSLAVKGNNRQISKAWIKKIIEREIDRYLNYNRLLIQHKLGQLCSVINPKDLIKMAFKPLSTSQIRSKQRWIDCYKIVKNINRYLKQYLYNIPQMKQIDSRITESKKQAQQKIYFYIKNKLKEQIKTVFSRNKLGNIQRNIQQKNIDYYEREFGIELSAYKNTENLQQIQSIVQSISENLSEGGSELEYFKSYILYELDDKIRNIKKYFNAFIAQNIEPIIVGCNARCPGCGMKCYKTTGHADGHALWQESHVLQCFKGKVYHQTNKRSADLCFTSQNIFQKYVFLPEENTTKTIYEWIRDKYPDWLDHYLDRKVYTKNKDRCKGLNIIWANIEYVIIKYKFHDMIPDPSIKDLQLFPLEEEDIISNKLEDY